MVEHFRSIRRNFQIQKNRRGYENLTEKTNRKQRQEIVMSRISNENRTAVFDKIQLLLNLNLKTNYAFSADTNCKIN